MAGSAGSGEQWSSRWGFLLAAVGFAVGMGNIWRFPYVLGENGGSAFLFIYLAFALGIGLPLLITEIAIGRRGQSSATGSFRAVAAACGRSKAWGHVGTLGIFCAFVILSYYTVISGWTLDYFLKAASGSLQGVDADSSSAMFSGLLNNPGKLLFWNTIVHLLIIFVIRRGVQGGIESAVKILMPSLFVTLIIMVIYGMVAGDMSAALKFLLEPDFSKVTFNTAMLAIGQAFFSIGIGMGSLVVFGSYMPKDFSIVRSATAVILLDTGVAVVAGLAIFPLVFQYGLDAGSGAGLIFQTLPLAFGQMPGGQFFGSIFFVLLISAALSSCIGLAEGVVNWVDEHWGIERKKGVLYVAAAGWLLGVFSIMSLGKWSDYYPLDFVPSYEGKNIFNALDHLAANNLLLVGGCLSAIFFGWLVPKALKLDELDVADGLLFTIWRFTIRFIIPPILIVVLLSVFLEL
ncbi:MAG: sodium-dependent transporter [Gammaproteobacteria bacterium]|nr:MAG: sodium-dependent transporter [Gammaproteobacteria bacterium]RLA35423.1 MAG: sodium-dependent transporter [Gammaproteobacteria bacterium]